MKAKKIHLLTRTLTWHFSANFKTRFWNGHTNPDEGICKTADECEYSNGKGGFIEWLDRSPVKQKDCMTKSVEFDKGAT